MVPFTSFWYILFAVLDRSLFELYALVVDHSSTALATFKFSCEFLFQTKGQVMMFCFPLKWQEAKLNNSLRIIVRLSQKKYNIMCTRDTKK